MDDKQDVRMGPFIWKRCENDVYAKFRSRTVDAYVTKVMRPGIAALDKQIDDYARSGEIWAPFAKGDLEALRTETFKIFALALQSLWERQLRDYIVGCARTLKLAPSVSKMALSPQKDRVEKAFLEARGIGLHHFPSYGTLNILHLIGNICRHGNGISVSMLHGLRPDLWPDTEYHPVDLKPYPHVPTADSLRIDPELLDEFAAAIDQFWFDLETIYYQTLSHQGGTVAAELEKRRSEGAWMPPIQNSAGAP
ncbi:hypothetical protein [Sphingopyxis chilensis]